MELETLPNDDTKNEEEETHQLMETNWSRYSSIPLQTESTKHQQEEEEEEDKCRLRCIKLMFKWLLGILNCCQLTGTEEENITLYRIRLHTGGWVSPSNRISTTKYSLLSFLPKFLFDQFSRLSNLFFLIITLLQQIPGVSPFINYSTAVPLSFVLLLAAIKEIIEDIRRYRADKEVNNRIAEVLRPNGDIEEIHWDDIRAGNIVRIKKDEFFPADLVFLSSSDSTGLCYLQTTNLDGENNLKIRKSHSLTSELKEIDLADLKGFIECELPNKRLYEFTGSLNIDGDQRTIDVDNILLRGAQLRNTAYIYGAVVYTGHDTKILQNSRSVPLKRSRVDFMTNKQILLLLVLLVVLASISSICNVLWNIAHVNHWYIHDYVDQDPFKIMVRLIASFLTFLILYSNLVPISLIVTIEIVKFAQGLFISWDEDMYYSPTDTPAVTRNSNLNEELGQIQYIFSDKTGTLTNNIMTFKKCSINGQIYSLSEETGDDLLLSNELHSSHVLQFIRTLCLCHSVIPEQLTAGQISYYATSPDEEAFVCSAQRLGVVYQSNSKGIIVLDVLGKREEYKVLNTLQYSSSRQRMSVIVRTPNGEIKLLCKGSDMELFKRVTDSTINERTEQHITQFAVTGLRTLCVAEATLTEEQYKKWSRQLVDAEAAIDGRQEKLDEVFDLIEQDLQLLGATAVEDELQNCVPDTITKLHQAGIKVWMVTGDKMETAISVGFSSRLLSSDIKLYTIEETSEKDVKAKLVEALSEVRKMPSTKCALAINGKALAQVLNSNDVIQYFVEFVILCHSVICCRTTPSQKAEIVELINRKVSCVVTLAIGDGANDVSMIQSAHVGVGIAGREGTQAVMASDYSIAQFEFLTKLLLIHGAWDYQRLTKVILYSFYKNICLYVIEFWFALHSGFSGQTIFEEWTIGLFNVFFTSLLPFVIGFCEQDTHVETRLQNPSLYRTGITFNTKTFWTWVILAYVHSLIAFYGTKAAVLSDGSQLSNGETSGLIFTGNVIFSVVVVTVSIQALLISDYWTIFIHLGFWGSLGAWFLFLYPYSHIWPAIPFVGEWMVGQDEALFCSVIFYAAIMLLSAIAVLPYVFYKGCEYNCFPSAVQKLQHKQEIDGTYSILQ